MTFSKTLSAAAVLLAAMQAHAFTASVTAGPSTAVPVRRCKPSRASPLARR
jgi:hypothetical protein